MSESASAVVTYSCDAGFAEIDQVLSQNREFMPATACPAIECQRRHGGGAGGPKNVTVGAETLVVQTRAARLCNSRMPVARMTLWETTVVMMDWIAFFCPDALSHGDSEALQAGLVSSTYLDARNIIVRKQSYDDVAAAQSPEDDVQRALDEILPQALIWSRT